MSIKDLFNKSFSSYDSATSGSKKTESYDYMLTKTEKNKQFQPRIDYNSASTFSFYGSAELYYKSAMQNIYNNYPYDGSKKEKLRFHLTSSQFEEWVFYNQYPKTTGYVNLSYAGWGTRTSITDGYGLPASVEYIYSRGGMHTSSVGMIGKELFKTFDSSVKYEPDNNRTTTYRINPSSGLTVEFWLKKAAFDIAKTEKEVILDLWNGNISSSADYGRFTLILTSSAQSDGSSTFLATLQSGTVGFFNQVLGTSTITTGSLSDWHHYAFSFVSASTGVDSRIYLDGNLNQKKSLGSAGVNEIGGLINGYIGALQTSPSSSQGAATGVQYAGKLSASLDEFRYWKTRRTSEQIADSWNTPVGAGNNTDLSNKELGVYYKFNEGITNINSYDSSVLDYSGRIADGTWVGYSAGSRNTGSAIVSSSAHTLEPHDPIIYSVHPEVISVETKLIASGSIRDADNGTMLINRFPSWIIEEDESSNQNFKYLTQIIASFLDELYLEISELRKLKFAEYYPTSIKPLPFADRLLVERGFDAQEILQISTILEKFENRNIDSLIYENSINDIKNLIYQNIYNNLPKILKSKGTERSIRNLLRCFGVDDELLKLNVYTNRGTHYFTDKYKTTSQNKKVIDFGNSNNFSSAIHQTSSINNPRTYIYGSDSSKFEKYNAFTLEINTIIPFKVPSNFDEYVYYGELTSSIGGFHEAVSDATKYTFASTNTANLQMYVIRDSLDSKNAKFMLKNVDGTIKLTSELYFDVYDNNLWTLAARVKPIGYPFYGSYSSDPQNYIVDFYGVRHKAGEIEDYFHLSSSVSYAIGSSYLSNRKRVYVGASRTNFTGSILNKSDIKISNCRFYLDFLENSVLNEHNKDINIHGSNKTFEGNTAFGTNLSNKRISSLETIALNWDFNKVTGSNSSGKFIVEDISSGSVDTIYGWVDEIIRREHRGGGYNFVNSSTKHINNELLTLYKKELPEISYTADNIKIAGIEQEAFLDDAEVSDSLYVLEKSFHQVISEKMLESLSSTSEMNNLFGKAIERYRINYKNLDYARRIFFDKVEEDPDFDKFSEYFKWLDKSIFNYIEKLIPASVIFNSNVSETIESHMFERNKVRTLIPNKFIEASPDDHINGIRELTYNWKFGHAPIGGLEKNNCLWQKERKERKDISDRETIRKVIINDNNQSARTLVTDTGTTYQGSTYALRRLSRVYKESVTLMKYIHGGTNYEVQKDRNLVYNVTERHSDLTSIGIPRNLMVVGTGLGQGLELPDCDDTFGPDKLKKFFVKVFIGKFAASSGGGYESIDGVTSFAYGIKGVRSLPFSLSSQTVTTGYNSKIHSGYKADSELINLHSDTTGLTNEVPMQGPFAETWVGGHQSRHTEITKYDLTLRDDENQIPPPNSLHNMYTRPEAFRILVGENDGSTSDGALGIADPQYGLTQATGHPMNNKYPDINKKSATYFREERTKRPVNIANRATNASSNRLGNYKENYEIISIGSGRKNNNLFFRDNEASHVFIHNSLGSQLPTTTQNQSLFGFNPKANGNVFGDGESNLFNPNTNGVYQNVVEVINNASSNKSVIVSRFSAPGGIETMTYGFLDAYSQEMSAYNAMTYRNLLVRGSGSGEAGTIRLDDHLGNRHGLLTHLSRHSGKFGADSVYGTVTAGSYVTKPSYHKIPRNTRRKLTSDSSLASPVFNLDHDNYFVRTTLPRSDFQYAWITSSLGSNYSINSGKQRLFGYSPRNGIMSSSYEVHGESGYVGAITFPTASELFGE